MSGNNPKFKVGDIAYTVEGRKAAWIILEVITDRNCYKLKDYYGRRLMGLETHESISIDEFDDMFIPLTVNDTKLARKFYKNNIKEIRDGKIYLGEIDSSIITIINDY